MPIFEVKLEREQYQFLYVEAGDRAQAVDAAWELAEDRDWTDTNENGDTHEITHMPEGQRYWSGGASGGWVEP